MIANFNRAEFLIKEGLSGSHVMTYKGYEIRFQHISYKCPQLGIFGAKDTREIKRLINKELKKQAVKP